jgi:Tol biopolymer transport system component
MTWLMILSMALQDVLVVKDDDIQILTSDGSYKNITNNGKDMREESPSWSPDGKRIVYVAGKGIPGDLFIAEADGSGTRRLAKAKGMEKYGHPKFSPDGKRVLAVMGSMEADLVLFDVESAAMIKLTEGKAMEHSASWSKDSKKIVFIRQEYVPQDNGGTWSLGNVWVMNADGSGQKRRTNHDRKDMGPVWSPDGSKIVFISEAVQKRDGNVTMMGGDDLFIVNADGNGLRQITSASKSSNEMSSISWSPDGRHIVYAGRMEGAPNTIHVIEPDGSNGKELLESKWGQEFKFVQFSSDGKRLLIQDGYKTIRTVNADGSDYKQLGEGYFPQWCPSIP